MTNPTRNIVAGVICRGLAACQKPGLIRGRFLPGLAALFAALLLGQSPASAQSSAGNTIRFDGINDFASFLSFGQWMPTNQFTIEFWQRAEEVRNQTTLTTNPDHATNRLSFAGPRPDLRVYFDVGDTNAGGRLDYAPAGVLTNVWMHVALVYSDADDQMTIYRNGVLDATKTSVSLFQRGSYNLIVGANTAIPEFFKGSIDEIRIWNLARAQSDIQLTMSHTVSSDAPGLVAYYKLDEASGATVNDGSTNNHDGSLSGAPSHTGSTAPIDDTSATTTAAFFVGPSSATLQGQVNPWNLNTTAWIEWGLPGAETNRTTIQNVGSGTNAVTVTRPVSGLPSGTTFRYRIVATNELFVKMGAFLTFQTTFSFMPIAASGLPALERGALAVGDYDNDGALDLFASGFGAAGIKAMIYRNNGSGIFSEEFANFGVAGRTADWGDYDNDGDLDLLLSGETASGQLTDIFRNNGTNFAGLRVGFPNVVAGTVAWGDYDNDGRLDVLLTGSTNGLAAGAISRIYRNDGASFSNINANLLGVYRGAAAWLDFDRDGDLDFLLTGSSSSSPTNSRLYRNIGGNVFTNVTASIQGVFDSAVAVGDFDGDGWPDLALCGGTNSPSVRPSFTRLYRNSSGTFIANALLTGYAQGALSWGDFDNDGDLDLLATGTSDGAYTGQDTTLFQNQSGTFTGITAPLSNVWRSAAVWGDFDSDNRLDAVVMGQVGAVASTTWTNNLVRSLNGPANTPPAAPIFLSPFFGPPATNDLAYFLWSVVADGQTPSSGLSYNLRVGTAPGGFNVISPQSDPVTGERLVVGLGNIGYRTFGFVSKLDPTQTYYWSVQAVDTAFAGGPWSQEAAYHYLELKTVAADAVSRTRAVLQGSANPFGLEATGWFEWGTNIFEATTGQSLGAGIGAVIFGTEISLASFPPNTTVYYRTIATNAVGVPREGEILQFRVPFLATSSLLLSNGLAMGQANVCTLTITNLSAGNAALNFTFEGGTPSWVGVTGPITLAAGSSGTIALAFNANGLADGLYQTTLIIDPGGGQPPSRVPVTLMVGPGSLAKPGDLNRDGVVDLNELNLIIQYYRGLLP